MNNLQFSACLLIGSVFISAVSQIMLKKSTMKKYDSLLLEYLNPLVICAYGIFFLATILTMFSMRYLPLSLAPILESSSYIFVSIMGYVFLKEKFTKRKLAGLLVILAGIVIFNM